MTPEERAEKILQLIDWDFETWTVDNPKEAIAAEIRAAVEEERDRQLTLSSQTVINEIKCCEKVRDEAFRAGQNDILNKLRKSI